MGASIGIELFPALSHNWCLKKLRGVRQAVRASSGRVGLVS